MHTWRLIVCINLTGLRGAQIANKTLPLGVFVSAFPEEINVRITRLDKMICSHQGGWASSRPLSQTDQEGGGVPSSPWAGTSIFSCPQTSVLLVLGSSDSKWHVHLAVTLSHPNSSGLQTQTEWYRQLADRRPWVFSASMIVWANSHINQSTVHQSTNPINPVSLENPGKEHSTVPSTQQKS